MKEWHTALHFTSDNWISAHLEANLIRTLRSFSPAPARAARSGSAFDVVFNVAAESEFDASLTATDIALRLQELSEIGSLSYEGFSLTLLPEMADPNAKTEERGYLVVFRDQRRLTVRAESFSRHQGFNGEGNFFVFRSGSAEVAQFETADVAAVVSIESVVFLAPALPTAVPRQLDTGPKS